MSEPAFLPSNTHAYARTTNHFLRGDGSGTTLTRHHALSSSNTRGGKGRRRAGGVVGVNSNYNQEAVTPLIPTVPHQPSTKPLHTFKDVAQQQQQQSGSTIPRVPATKRHIHNLSNDNSNNGSQTESTSTAPSNSWLFIPHAPQPGPITVSNGEDVLYPTSLDTQQPPQQQQQQKRRQLPFNSLPATVTATATATAAAGALTLNRTNSASSTSTTSVTYLRNAAAAFIATAHQNHFQFPHKVLHPEIQPLSTANLDLQHDFDDEDDDESFTSRELRSPPPRDVGARVMGGGGDIRGGSEQEFMTEDDDERLEDDRGRGFESTTSPLHLGQIVNSEEQFWRRQNQYDPSLFLSTTATTTDAAVDAIASSDTPLHPRSSHRPSPHITTTTSQLNSNNLQTYWSTETEEADQDHFLPSVQGHLPSIDYHLYHNHRQRQERTQHQRQMYLFGRQDNTVNSIHMQDRSAFHPPLQDNNYTYQQEVISDDPSSPLPPPPPLSFPSTTSFAPANNQHHPEKRTDDVNEFAESADRASWVSELSSAGDRNQGNQQQQPHDHSMSLFSPKVGGNNGSGSGGQAPTPWQGSRSEQDREVFEVCSRRLQLGYTPNQNIHKALVSSIRSSFLASLNGSQRASLMNGDSSGVQQSIPGDEDLQGFQQPWYQPQHLPYHASPDQEYASGFLEEARQRREQELLQVIAQLGKDLRELHSLNEELQTRLHESEERNERMVVEHDRALQRVKEEYDHQIHDTKKRTKRFYDETMRKRQRDEDKRLEGLQEQLAQTQTANKDLRTTIRGLQRERLDAEQDQRDDLSVLCLFIENVLSPMVFDLTESRDGSGVTHLQAVGAFKCRRPSTINTATTAIAKGNLYDHDLTPTTAVPHPIPLPLPTPSSQDNPPPKPTTTTTTRQCTSPRGQRCMSLLEQLQSALSIFFTNATAVATPTTPHNPDKASTIPHPARGGLQQEESPKTPAPFRKIHNRHTSTATNSTTTINTATTKRGRHDALTEDHLVRLQETERLEDLNPRRPRKRQNDSSSASSGHTFVAPAPPPIPFRQFVVSKITSSPMTAAVTPPLPAKAPRIPSASEKPLASVSISTPNSITTTAVSSPQKHTPLTITIATSSPQTKIKTKSNNTVDTTVEEKEKEEDKKKENEKEMGKGKGKGKGKEKGKEKDKGKEKVKDRSFQQCLAEQHTRYQKEIERIKQQCINIYRQSLEDVRADMKFKLGQAGRGGGQIRRDRSTTAVTAVPVVAAATVH